MSLIVTQRPSTAFQSNTCVHSAVGNPIIYKMQREDFQTNTVVNSGGNLRVTVTGDITAQLAVGDSVYYKSDNGVYDGYYTILTETYSAPDTTITFNGGYTAAGTTGFINLATRLNYKVSVEVRNNTTGLLLGTLRVSPNSKGAVIIDVSKLLESGLIPANIYNLFTYNRFEVLGTSLEFYIKYQGIWIGSSISQVDDVANKFFAVYGARQIGSRYNGFLPEYVSYNTPGTELPKLLATFTPRMWRGLPFSISAIFGQDLPGTHNFAESQRTSAGGLIAVGGSGSFTFPGRVVRFYNQNTNYDQNAAYVDIITEKAGAVQISGVQRVDIYEPSCNSILLHWTNSLGGDAWWNFENNHEYNFEYENGTKVRRMKLFAEGLTREEAEGINELNSPRQAYQTNIVEMTNSVVSTKAINGQQVYMFDQRDSEVLISSTANNAGNFEVTTFSPHGFPFDARQIIFFNSSVHLGYFYAQPITTTTFQLRDIVTNAIIAFSSNPSLTTTYCFRISRPIGVIVIPTSQTLQTKQKQFNLEVTIELPETQTL